MKIICETNVVKRADSIVKGRFQKSTLAIGRKTEKSKLCIVLISANNKSGQNYGENNKSAN